MGAFEIQQLHSLARRYDRIADLHITRAGELQIQQDLIELPLGALEPRQLGGGLEASWHPRCKSPDCRPQFLCKRRLRRPLSHNLSPRLPQQRHDRRPFSPGNDRQRRQHGGVLRQALTVFGGCELARHEKD